MRPGILSAAVGALATAACGGTGGGTALDWQPAMTLAGGAAPALAARADGRITAAWTGAPGGGADGRLFVRPNLGDSAAVELRDPAGALTIYGETPPKLTWGPDGTLYAAYLLTRAEPGHQWPTNMLRVATSADGGRTWGAPVTVQSDTVHNGSTDDHALLAAPDGTVYLAWLAQERDTSHSWLSASRDGGRTWSAPRVMDAGPACPCCRTALATGADGRLYAAWRRIFGRDSTEVRDIVVAASPDHGATWSAPVRVHEDDWHVHYCPDAGPTLRAGADGVLHVAWWTGKPGGAGVRYAQSRDGGRSFSAPVELGVAPASRAAHAQLALADARRVVVAWDDGTLVVPRIVVRRSADGGHTFAAADTLSAPGASAGYPVVAVARDTVVVAWQERTTAEASADSARHHDAMARAAGKAPDASQWINRVSSWSVVMRRAALR